MRQHLIDPEICIRCNTCEESCPVNAISHDSRNYVVDASICKYCYNCISPCPTGAIDNWRHVQAENAYPLAEQLLWDTLPEQVALEVPLPAVEAPVQAASPRRHGRPRTPTSISTRSRNRQWQPSAATSG